MENQIVLSDVEIEEFKNKYKMNDLILLSDAVKAGVIQNNKMCQFNVCDTFILAEFCFDVNNYSHIEDGNYFNLKVNNNKIFCISGKCHNYVFDIYGGYIREYISYFDENRIVSLK